MFQARGDYAGSARAYNNLAAIALDEKQLRKARAYVNQALSEANRATQMFPDDLAAIYDNAGWLSSHNHEHQQALRYHEQAVQMAGAAWDGPSVDRMGIRASRAHTDDGGRSTSSCGRRREGPWH